MRQIVLTAAALCMFTSLAVGQNMPAQQGPQNPAIKSTQDNNSTMPVAGSNSFTRKEAIKQIEARGYTHVKGLKKDKEGVWRGTAMKDGQTGPISVDYQGNVN